MKALTLYQPWASLVALGVKTIETRSWSTPYRGPLAIHAGAKRPPGIWTRWGEPIPQADSLLVRMAGLREFDRLFTGYEGADADGYWFRQWSGPLGAIVATCRLADVVPMRSEIPPGEEWGATWMRFWKQVTVGPLRTDGSPSLTLDAWSGLGPADRRDIGDEAPYGFFAPGRYAWLLENVEACDPIAAKGHQRLWNWEEGRAA